MLHLFSFIDAHPQNFKFHCKVVYDSVSKNRVSTIIYEGGCCKSVIWEQLFDLLVRGGLGVQLICIEKLIVFKKTTNHFGFTVHGPNSKWRHICTHVKTSSYQALPPKSRNNGVITR